MKDLSLLPNNLHTLSRRHSVSLCQPSMHEVTHLGEIMQGRRQETGGKGKKGKTLSLKLEEVKHIRTVLSKAKMEVKRKF